jgi:hypothetical protein
MDAGLAKEFRVWERIFHTILGEDGVKGGVVNDLVARVPRIEDLRFRFRSRPRILRMG